jgi:DNA-binding transcriptional LysR family regulator
MRTIAGHLDDMAVFASVVREGTFTAAARALGRPKSTISKRIGELEARLGVRLLQRTTRLVRPTEEGALYYEHCARVVHDAELADRALLDRDATPRGLVRVTAPVAAAAIMSPLAARFLRAYPGVSLEVILLDRRVDLVAEGFDVAIRVGPLRDSALVARRLQAAPRCACASPGYLARRPAPHRPGELRGHDCIGLGAARGPRAWMFERRGRAVTVEPAPRYVVSSPQLAREGALEGLGIACLPRFVVDADLAAGRLVEVLPGWQLPAAELFVLYPTARHLSPRVRAFVELATGG